MTNLSPHARSALDTLAEKQLAYTIAKATIEAELKDLFNERISSFKNERDMAMRLADEAGVPRTQLGKAIGTTNYRTVQEILDATVSMATQTTQDDTKYSISTTGNPDEFLVRIFDMGVGMVSGSATITVAKNELIYVSGDEFVIPQLYRNNYGEVIVERIKEITS